MEHPARAGETSAGLFNTSLFCSGSHHVLADLLLPPFWGLKGLTFTNRKCHPKDTLLGSFDSQNKQLLFL
jgi:hypothetical protein